MEKIKCRWCGTESSYKAKYCLECGTALPKYDPGGPVNHPVSKKGKGKNIRGTIMGVILFCLSSFAVWHIFFRTPPFDKVLMQMADKINRSCPAMIDTATRFDHAAALPGNTLQYIFTLINLDRSSIDTLELKQNLEPGIINNITTSPEMKYLRTHNTIFRYYYKDKEGSYACCISVEPGQYQ